MTGEQNITTMESESILFTLSMKSSLTDRQKSIYDFIEDYQMDHGCSPKIREIQESFEIKSINGVIKHLRALETKGWIERDNTPRGIKLFERARNKIQSSLLSIPVFGSIPAGTPQNLDEYIEGYQTIDASLLGNSKDVFALFVKGESMIDAGIHDGDVVFAAKKEPKFGDIVVALIDGESTLKRYMKDKNGSPYLKAENSTFPEIYPIHELEVQGVIVYLMRRYF